MGLKTLKDFTDLLIPLQDAYGQLETEYELQRAMLHEKHAENARLREALEEIADDDSWTDEPLKDEACIRHIARQALKSPHGD